MIKKIITNKVFLYVVSRYLTYALQFVLLIAVASKLGVSSYGTWGFFLMILGYCNIINFGIANSTNYFLVQNKSNETIIRYYASGSYVLIAIIVLLLLILVGIGCYVKPALFVKYDMMDKMILLSIVASMQYINFLFSNIYRVNNHLLELAIYQSSIPFSMLIVILFSTTDELLDNLIYSYIFAHSLSLLVFIIRNKLPKLTFFPCKYIKKILRKGFFLFLYNSCFYMIHYSTSLGISAYYSVDEYALYTFSYSLGHSILLLFEAFGFIIFPKLIDKFYTATKEELVKLIETIRNNYIKFAHLLMYFASLFFPIVILFFPKYSDALQAMYITSLSILISTNVFGYNILLLSRNYEKQVAIISITSMLLNIMLVFILASVFKLSFGFVIISMMLSYYFFSLFCIILANKTFGFNYSLRHVFNEAFDWRLLIPYALTLYFVFIQNYMLILVSVISYIILNMDSIVVMIKSIRLIINRPNIVDVKK